MQVFKIISQFLMESILFKWNIWWKLWNQGFVSHGASKLFNNDRFGDDILTIDSWLQMSRRISCINEDSLNTYKGL